MTLKWEAIKCERMQKSLLSTGVYPMLRAKVPGGWFVQQEASGNASGAFFYPDPEHTWDGALLP